MLVCMQPQVVLQPLWLLAHYLIHLFTSTVYHKRGGVPDAGHSLVHRLNLGHGIIVLGVLQARKQCKRQLWFRAHGGTGACGHWMRTA